jgi:hypothetical protein
MSLVAQAPPETLSPEFKAANAKYLEEINDVTPAEFFAREAAQLKKP